MHAMPSYGLIFATLFEPSSLLGLRHSKRFKNASPLVNCLGSIASQTSLWEEFNGIGR